METMSKNNFEDALHIVKKINFFLGMCMEDVDHLNYNDDAKMMLRFAINTHGSQFLQQLINSVRIAEKVNIIGDSSWEPNADAIADVQEEWNKRFGNVNKKKFKTENLFSEGQSSQENGETTEQDPRNNKGA